MTLSRRVARPMLASIFIVGGVDAFRNPSGKVKSAEAFTQPLAKAVPGVPNDTELLVKVNGAVQVGAGAMLALGKFRRLAALALIGSIIPTTYAGHRFWEETDDATKAQQRIHFLKNLGLLGGLILALVDTEGAPSLSWRAKRRAHRLGETVGSVVVATGALTHHGDASGKAHHAHDATVAKAKSAGRKASKAGGKASKVKGRAAKRAQKAATKSHRVALKGHDLALKGAHDASGSATRLADAGNRAARVAHDVALQRAHEAAATAGKLSESGGRAARKANKVAHQRAHEATVTAARLGESGGRLAKRANDVALGAAKSTAEAAKSTADAAKSTAGAAKSTAGAAKSSAVVKSTTGAAKSGAEAAKTAVSAARDTAGDAASYVAAGAERAGDVLSKVHDHLPVG